MLDLPVRTIATGLLALAVLLLILVVLGKVLPADAAMLALRAAHVFAAMIWIGLIWFVNFIQLAVLKEADESARATVMTWIAPRVATTFRHAATITLLTGLILLAALGYLTLRPVAGNAWLWAGVAGGVAMVAFVHARISPALKTLLDRDGADASVKAAARETIRVYARVNLLLALPVTFAMLAAAHG